MNKVLAVETRPCRFSDLIGQAELVQGIRKQIASNRMPKAWMLSGQSGGGKTTIARILAVSLQCQEYGDFGDPPTEMMARQHELDIMEINAADNNKVDDISRIIEISRYTPSPSSRFKVIIFDEAQRITSQAQQLLLKPTEDANSAAVWIFCTTDPGKILPTLKRRCQHYRVKPLGQASIKRLIGRVGKQYGIKSLQKFYDAVLKAELTSPGFILNALEKFSQGISADKAVLPEGMEADAFGVAQAVAAGDWRKVTDRLGDGKLDSEEARMVRAIVSGFLRTMLTRSAPGAKANAAAQALADMAATASTYDETMLSFHVIAALYKATSRFGGGGRGSRNSNDDEAPY